VRIRHARDLNWGIFGPSIEPVFAILFVKGLGTQHNHHIPSDTIGKGDYCDKDVMWLPADRDPRDPQIRMMVKTRLCSLAVKSTS
jgi:hypothetical protein